MFCIVSHRLQQILNKLMYRDKERLAVMMVTSRQGQIIVMMASAHLLCPSTGVPMQAHWWPCFA